RNRLNAPVTFLIEDDALRALDAGKVRFPLVVKPRRGQGSLGLHVVYEKAELSAALLLARAQVARFKDNGLSVKDGGLSVIIQEFLIGEEFGLDVVNDLEGQFRACLVKRKLGMRAGETDAAESVRDAALEKFGAAIGCALGHLGMLDVDVIVRNGQPYLLEFNPRFGGHYPFSHMAGANVPAALLAWARGEEPKPEWLQVGKGIISLKEYSMRVQMQTYA
ncbi:MAG TPA: ATP-grasp domain-containing protein, partial [Oligoflexia bacterium]|nr:ATP-grasp domain-containing protein [Oligoflexia bacterium]